MSVYDVRRREFTFARSPYTGGGGADVASDVMTRSHQVSIIMMPEESRSAFSPLLHCFTRCFEPAVCVPPDASAGSGPVHLPPQQRQHLRVRDDPDCHASWASHDYYDTVCLHVVWSNELCRSLGRHGHRCADLGRLLACGLCRVAPHQPPEAVAAESRALSLPLAVAGSGRLSRCEAYACRVPRLPSLGYEQHFGNSQSSN